MKSNKLSLFIFILIICKVILFVILIPPWQGPDEPFHFKTADFQLSEPSDKEKFTKEFKESLKNFRFYLFLYLLLQLIQYLVEIFQRVL